MPYRLCRSSSLVRFLTSGRIASLCSLSSSDAPNLRGVYIRSFASLFLSSSFYSTILCLVEVRHCWSPIEPPSPSVHCLVVERTLCWLIFLQPTRKCCTVSAISAIHSRLVFGFWVFCFAYSFGSAFPFFFAAVHVAVSSLVSFMQFPSYQLLRFQLIYYPFRTEHLRHNFFSNLFRQCEFLKALNRSRSFNQFICRRIHVTRHSRFCARIYVFKTHQSSCAFLSSHV